MSWSGLSILDAVPLERRRLEGDRLFLYGHKTKVPVYVPLPTTVAKELKALPNSNARYFFWSSNGDPHTAKKGWQRSMRLLFKTVNLKTEDGRPKRCHPHMFRDTFAIELLLAGVPLDQVALLLGHSSTKITEKHYAPFGLADREEAISVFRYLSCRPEVPMDAKNDRLWNAEGDVPPLESPLCSSPSKDAGLILEHSAYGVLAELPHAGQF